MTIIEKAVAAGLIKFNADQSRICYCAQKKWRNYNNPEERVQASVYCKLALEYGYPRRRIRVYEPVQMGASPREADIVVFDDDELQTPRIVVECKKEDTPEAEIERAVEQAFSYAVTLGARYVWATSGLKNEHYEVSAKAPRARRATADIPRYGSDKISRYKYAYHGEDAKSGNFESLRAVPQDELTRRFRQAHDALWAGGELDPSAAFDEFNKLVFCKLWDEKISRKPGEPYDFQVIEEDDNAKTNDKLAARVRALYAQGKSIDQEVFDEEIKLTPIRIRPVVDYLQGIDLSETDLDSKGRAFETFMGSFFKGDFGQFFTPREIVEFIMRALPIGSRSTVLDTSCGSGGFLLYALDKVRRQAAALPRDTNAEKQRAFLHWHDFAQNRLFGIEVNERIARVAKMNMILHDDGHTNVVAADGLLSADALQNRTGNRHFGFGKFDFIVTNPPFGSAVRQVERAYLSNYKLAHKEVNWLDETPRVLCPGQKTEVLFIEQCWRYLKPGGYLAIVLHDGILTGGSMQSTRDEIEEMFRIVAVVSMPQTAFAPTGAGVKTSVVFLRRHFEEEAEAIVDRRERIWEEIRNGEYKPEKEKIEARRVEDLRLLRGLGLAPSRETPLREIKKTPRYREWKKSVKSRSAAELAALRARCLEQNAARKNERAGDYPVLMAIAGDIGYDATGRKSGKNDLPAIGDEVAKFIAAIEKEKDRFFA